MNDPEESGFGVGFFLGFIVAGFLGLLFLIQIVSGTELAAIQKNDEKWEKQLVEKDLAHYDAKTGKWQYNK